MLQLVTDAAAVQDCPPGLAVATYPLMAAPPVLPGVLQLTTMVVSAGVTMSDVGADGTLTTATGGLAAEAGPAPMGFDPTTVKVYVVPPLRPLIRQVVPAVVQVIPPGLAVAT